MSEDERKFSVVARVAYQIRQVKHRVRRPGDVSLLAIATNEFGLTFPQYSRVLEIVRNDFRRSERQRLIDRGGIVNMPKVA